MADSGLIRLVNRGIRFATTKAAATYVGLRTAANPASSFDIVLPNTLPTVVPQPLSMGLDGTLQYSNDFSSPVTVAASKTLALSDSYTTQLFTAASTITIPANATVAYPIGTEIQLLRNTSAVVTLALAAGVTATGRTGAANTLMVVTNYVLLKKIAINTWLVASPVPSNPVVSLKRSTALSIPNNAATQVPLNVVEIDTDNIFNSANGTIVIPTGAEGTYILTGMATLTAPVQQFRLTILVNGSVRIQSPGSVFTGDFVYGNESTRTLRLNVGDIVSLQAYQSNTTSVTKNLETISEYQACLQITKTGP